MRHLRLLLALAFLCAIFGTIHGQNRGSSRYVPSSSDDFEGESTRAPRAPQIRGVRRQRPTPVPEPAEHPEDVQRSRQAPSTTARRVPSRVAAPQQFAPPAPLEPFIPEEPVAPVEPSPAPETRPKRRRTKKRKRPSTKPIEEKLDIENAAEPEVAPKTPFDVSSNLSPPSDFQNNGDEAGPQQFYPPQPATNRLPVENADDVHQGSRVLQEEPLVQYSPVSDPPARGAYVPILPPVRVPAEGSSRLPTENIGRGNLNYRTPQRSSNNRSPSADSSDSVRGSGARSRQRSPPVEDPSEINRNSGARSPQRSPSPPIADPSEVIRNSGARAPQNNIFRNDQPEDPEHAEERLLLPEDLPIPGYSNQPEESPVLNRFEEELKSIEDHGRGEPVPSNRLPSPPEQDSSYPSYLDSSAVREPSRNTVPSRSNVEVPTRSVPTTRGASRTETEPKDTGRGVSRYQPPLQRSSSRSNTEDSDTPTRSRSPPSEAPTRTRGPTRNRQESPSEAPTRTRGSTRYQQEGESTPTRTRDQPSRTRSGQRYQPEPVESDSRINTRRQPAAPEPEEGSPTDRVRSSAAALPSPYPGDFDQNPVRHTLRSRPQFDSPEALYEEPVYEEPIREEPVPYEPEYQPEAPVQRAPPRRPEQPAQRAPQQPVQRAPQRPQNNRPDTRSRSPQQSTRSQSQYEAPRRDAPRPQYEAPRREQSAPPPRQQQPPKARQQEASPRSASKFTCPEPYGFYADPVQCDKYYECRNGTAFDSLCEDGLAFNEISAPKYLRCDSLRDVDCAKRPQLQEARSTKNCPRRFGLYPHESDCTKFWNCIDGTASEVQCPAGLTFNDDKASCDWADLVKSSCKTEDLLGFSCPQVNSYDLQAGDGVYTTYPHPDNCQLHFVCLKGEDGERRPRLLSCNEGLVYSTQTKSCTRPDNVPGCEEFYGPRPKRKPAREEEPEAEEPKPRRTQTRTRTRN